MLRGDRGFPRCRDSPSLPRVTRVRLARCELAFAGVPVVSQAALSGPEGPLGGPSALLSVHLRPETPGPSQQGTARRDGPSPSSAPGAQPWPTPQLWAWCGQTRLKRACPHREAQSPATTETYV